MADMREALKHGDIFSLPHLTRRAECSESWHAVNTGKFTFGRGSEQRYGREFCAEADMFPIFRRSRHSISEEALRHDFAPK
ncbi:hypothetical protein R20233_01251 [Ralstonia sp. LMG 32965]|nr:hypothetical protein R20233_01251 [Ralstonia sp. LMG 32965]